ncbi:1-deoxy-D-xylulose-5-phosphate synthase [Alkaliphilus serpentinus]|uniref:1-deoxy-D-xylulose-5-phosphate synthase n=1 Tax=Alkaliphilus serpentinus TaxID=1482731 RepID=A0A833M9D3_9FIRM|nr:1-deoxy-D-xylulose-5-phosphate synthase [Alkaliphilus serpentinus]KAB3527564.1 1-deoxy-D-xylulose-5-phosphate synthase [Alkaliphilus serpentinus]
MYSYLSGISMPEDLKKLTEKEVEVLIKEIRNFLIESVSKTGGHLASNLGVVELTLALHTVFDTSKDRILWDVGHQSYVHKILTGRKDEFHTLRQYKGISGFPKISESIHDHFNTGHSSTSISAALGMAFARDLQQQDHSIIAVIGDGALTGGMAFEALNHAGQSKKNLMVILNDNEMSISPNVGGLSDYLTRIRTAPIYYRVKGDIEQLIGKIPAIGKSVVKTVEKAKDSIKYFFVPGILFEELGFTYIGPVDGHNYESLCKVLNKYKNLNGPVLVHVITKKGKGYKPAETSPHDFHGVSPFKIDSGEPLKAKKKTTFSDIAGSTLVKAAEADDSIVAITAAMPSGTGLTEFSQKFPERFIDVGIAEQHAVTLAAGLAAAGCRPVFPVYSTFLQRGYDQVLHDVCLQNLPVTLLLDRAGLVGNDGETHHGVFDISFLSCIPNLVMMAPKDGDELQEMIQYSLKLKSPVAIRYPRGNAGITEDSNNISIHKGKGEILFEAGKDALIIALGTMCEEALKAAHTLAQKGIKVTIINPRFIKPLDEGLILEYANKCNSIYTIEDHVKHGGFGSQVLSLLNDHSINKEVRIFAIPDEFVEHGDVHILHDYYHLCGDKLAQEIQQDFLGNVYSPFVLTR